MRREQKNAKIQDYQAALDTASFAVLAEFSKLSVATMEHFRRDLTGLGYKALVMKNTLARIVFERQGLSQVCEYMVGPSVLVYGSGEASPAAKLLARFMRENPSVVVKAIVFDGGTYPRSEFTSFLTMPTRDELRAKLLRVMLAPLSNFARIIHPTQRLVTVLGSYGDKRGRAE